MENQKTKKVYMTKKRRANILKKKLIVCLIITGTLSGIIMSASNELNKSIEELAHINNPIKKAEASVEVEIIEVVSETIREVTAYDVGDPLQTDDSPCIGAYSKVNLCDEVEKGTRICAANFVPLGTRLQITANNGWEFECVVWDRMNSRFANRVDIAMSLEEKERAVKFGVQNLNVRILGDREIVKK